MEREVPCVQMQTLLPDCSVRKLQPVNADIEKSTQWHPKTRCFTSIIHPLLPGRAFERYVRIAARQNDGRQILYWLF